MHSLHSCSHNQMHYTLQCASSTSPAQSCAYIDAFSNAFWISCILTHHEASIVIAPHGASEIGHLRISCPLLRELRRSCELEYEFMHINSLLALDVRSQRHGHSQLHPPPEHSSMPTKRPNTVTDVAAQRDCTRTYFTATYYPTTVPRPLRSLQFSDVPPPTFHAAVHTFRIQSSRGRWQYPPPCCCCSPHGFQHLLLLPPFFPPCFPPCSPRGAPWCTYNMESKASLKEGCKEVPT